MSRRQAHAVVTVLIAAVWIAFGLFAKLLDFVPRHQEIVARILGPAVAAPLTPAIGLAEVGMGLWVLSRYRRRLCAVVQIALVGAMNLLEATLAPDLLLWGRFNALFALAFMALIWANEWRLGRGVVP